MAVTSLPNAAPERNLDAVRARVRAVVLHRLPLHFAGPNLGYAEAMACYQTYSLVAPPRPEDFGITAERARGLDHFVAERLAEAVERDA